MEILGRRIVEFLDELPLVPAACILLVSRCTEYADAKKDEIKGLVTAVKGCLPDSCALIGCVGAGIIGTGEGGFSEEVEMAEGVALLLMPQIEGVSAKVINLNITEVKNNRTFKSRWEKSLKIPSDGTVKCAFLLAKGDTYNLDVIGKVASGIWKVNDPHLFMNILNCAVEMSASTCSSLISKQGLSNLYFFASKLLSFCKRVHKKGRSEVLCTIFFVSLK